MCGGAWLGTKEIMHHDLLRWVDASVHYSGTIATIVRCHEDVDSLLSASWRITDIHLIVAAVGRVAVAIAVAEGASRSVWAIGIGSKLLGKLLLLSDGILHSLLLGRDVVLVLLLLGSPDLLILLLLGLHELL